MLGEAEGGRRTPFATGYRPQFFFGATDVTGTVDLGCVSGVVSPGERTKIRFRLDCEVGIEPGMRFALREAKKTVGAGIVTAVE
jgi:elongation factor Tu